MRLRSAGLTLLLLAVAACKSSDATGPNNNHPANGSMTATIDGAAWNASLTVHASSTNGIVGVAGTDATQTIAFALAANGPGTYSIGPLSPENAELTTTGGIVFTAAGNVGGGSVTITSLTSTAVAGTFTFTMVKSGGGANRSVTNGAFNIKF